MSNSRDTRAESRRIMSLLLNRPFAENETIKEKNGRPILPGYSGDFNISHSGSMAAAAILNSSGKTGCDIQIVRPKTNIREIAQEFFSAEEINHIFRSGEKSGKNKPGKTVQSERNKFFQIWALKECYIKLSGLSVFNMASVPSFINNRGAYSFYNETSVPLSFWLYELTGQNQRYFLAAALESETQNPPEIRWYSQSFLPCKNIAAIKAEINPARTVNPKI